MFWSKPKLPISTDEQRWMEESYEWLLKQFGTEYFLKRKTILPIASCFPDRYLGTEESAIKVARRICHYMDVDPESIEVDFFAEWAELEDYKLRLESTKKDSVAGYYSGGDAKSKMRIAIHLSKLKEPTALVATISHELGHVILLGGGRISRDYKSHEQLTDLITVFLGMGVFTANAAFQFHQWQDTSQQGWRVSRLGYLSEEMFGYALAAYCWLRNEQKPEWRGMLAINVRHHFQESQIYLSRGGITRLKPLVN